MISTTSSAERKSGLSSTWRRRFWVSQLLRLHGLGSSHHGKGFVKRSENPRLTDGCSDAVPVHVRPQVRTHTREDHAHSLARQIIEQIAYGSCCGVIDSRDRARIDDEPSDRCRRALNESTHFVDKTVVVRVEQVRTPIAMVKTMAASTQRGRYWSGPVRNSSTTARRRQIPTARSGFARPRGPPWRSASGCR